jgi:hypothetical protein
LAKFFFEFQEFQRHEKKGEFIERLTRFGATMMSEARANAIDEAFGVIS